MTPVLNIVSNEGATIVVSVWVQESDGTAADLTGYTGSVQVRPDPLSDEVLATGTVVADDGGLVTATIPASQTVDWSAGEYDVRLVGPAGAVEYICRGTIKLEPSVTQP